MCKLTEANTTDIEISHIASLTRTELTASYDATSILWFALCADLN
jgi:hypothetical protein